MFKILSILLIGLFVVGCGVSTPKVKVEPNRAPLSVKAIAGLDYCTSPDIWVQVYGGPQSIKKIGDKTYWLYPVSDEQLKEDIIYEIYIYSRNLAWPTKSMTNLPYKVDKDILRDKYYYNLEKMNDADCNAASARSMQYMYGMTRKDKEEYKEEERQELDKKEKYQDKLFDLKEQIIKEKGELPVWFIKRF